ncbi:MAG: 3-deoxy-8-phosphooctulonate synthase, partial [Terriglobales bacterium]
MNARFAIGKVPVGGRELFLIAGPCVIESEQHALWMAREVAARAAAAGLPYIFKASYDKANRSSGNSFRGPGLERGLEIL